MYGKETLLDVAFRNVNVKEEVIHFLIEKKAKIEKMDLSKLDGLFYHKVFPPSLISLLLSSPIVYDSILIYSFIYSFN